MEILKKEDWYVVDVADRKKAKELIEKYHYAKGGSHTSTYLHGLFRRTDNALMGVAWWLPPTRVAAESVNKENWKKVHSLSRLVLHPDVPKNGASFLLSQSVKLIKKEGRAASLVTYADTEQGHTGHIYRCANWTYVGLTKPTPVWVKPDGSRVAKKSTVSRTNAEMKSLGYLYLGSFPKHKFILHLERGR